MVALVASIAVTFGIAAVFLLNVRKPHAPTRPAARVSLPKTGQHVDANGTDQALTRDFKILRRPLRLSDRLSGTLTQIATPNAPISGDSRPASLGLVPRLAREASLPGTPFRAWLIPGRHGLCWAAEYRTQVLGAFCSSFQNPATALTAADGYASVKTTTGFVTIGLVTDRVLALQLIGPNGQRKPVPITDGFYTVDGTPGKDLLATTATGSQILPRASNQLVLNTVGSENAIVSPPHQRAMLLAQIALRSPAGDRTPNGIARIYNSTHGISLSLTIAGVSRKLTHKTYAVWLYSTPHAARLLGFITQRPNRHGTVTTGGVLPSNTGRYQQILVTIENQTHLTTPGKIILTAPLSLPAGHKK
ncbi:MAG TPA: hypothetical protein VG388_14015 [Solirubrobacteraceae bacterium]|jgi:hypothetical protein|nr:hypothetical protein [Solirubrobacteraceae bacterium]